MLRVRSLGVGVGVSPDKLARASHRSRSCASSFFFSFPFLARHYRARCEFDFFRHMITITHLASRRSCSAFCDTLHVESLYCRISKKKEYIVLCTMFEIYWKIFHIFLIFFLQLWNFFLQLWNSIFYVNNKDYCYCYYTLAKGYNLRVDFSPQWRY